MDKARFHEYLNRSHLYRFVEWLARDSLQTILDGPRPESAKSVIFLVGLSACVIPFVMVVVKAIVYMDLPFLLVVVGFFGFLEYGFRTVKR